MSESSTGANGGAGDVPAAKAETKRVIREAGVEIEFQGDSNAFYNPAQEFNRDLSVCVARFLVAERAREAAELTEELQGLADSADSAPGASQDPAPKTNKPEGKTVSCAEEEKKPPVKEGGEGKPPGKEGGEGKPVEGLGRKRRRLEDRRKPLRLLEALSASGLRAIRYAKEVEGLAPVLANDFSRDAVALIRANVERNGAEGLVEPHYGDAIAVMHAHKVVSERFHVVDLDPYGSPAQFLDSAVQAVADDGVLMVTCTDVAVLCGNAPETCFAKYGSLPLRSKACHEAALRIVLRCVESHANRYARYVTPLLSLSVDFYLRLFLRLNTSPQRVKDSVTKVAWLEQCVGCGAQRLQPLAQQEKGKKVVPARLAHPSALCDSCGQAHQVAGPIWSAPIHQRAWVEGLLASLKAAPDELRPATANRIRGMLSLVLEELEDVPLFYDYGELCHQGKVCVPKLAAFRSALLNAGFRVSASHADARAIKTDAPVSFLFDIVRHIATTTRVNKDKFPAHSVTHQLLSRAMGPVAVDMALHKDADPPSRLEGLLRFQDNKGRQHGPKAKAKGSIHSVQAAAYAHTAPDPKRAKLEAN